MRDELSEGAESPRAQKRIREVWPAVLNQAVRSLSSYVKRSNELNRKLESAIEAQLRSG
jgi:hypothetical protein